MKKILFLASLTFILLPLPSKAYFAFELDVKGIYYSEVGDGPSVPGDEGRGEATGRIMVLEGTGDLLFEGHLLGGITYNTGGSTPAVRPISPFRSWDLEEAHHRDDHSTVFSEIDRLSLTLDHPGYRISAGRQAVTWGESYYYNPQDLFGAFPLTDVTRLHKPGLDAVTLTVPLSSFSEISLVGIPGADLDSSGAFRILFPAGGTSVSVVGGTVVGDTLLGGGLSLDVKGTRLFGEAVVTDPDGEDEFIELVAGGERWLDEYTRILGELYYSGWGSQDPDEYPDLLLSDRYLQGRVLTLGRLSAALDVSRQITPLLTGRTVTFANLSDGSVLLRLDGLYSLSETSDLVGGIWAGIGRKSRAGRPGSEYGDIPVSLYAEVVMNF
ncbi:MAG: hypothetical protein JSV26_01335 [bacterium]|nr:MAG: hypothetical protein JSV26_01335 [bacterium]